MDKATAIVGRCRASWSWDGKAYTSAGVLVPQSVMAEDEELYEQNKEPAPDDQVLDMKVTLPAKALPDGSTLVELPKAVPEPPELPPKKKT